MPVAGYPWIKLYTDFINDPKMGRLQKSPRLLFVELLALAGECDADGYLVGDSPMTNDDIAWRLREDDTVLAADLATLEAAGLIAQEDGAWLVVNFAKRQGRRQSEQQARWRDRKARSRAAKASDTQDADVTGDTGNSGAPPDPSPGDAGNVTRDKENVTRDMDVSHTDVTLAEERRGEKEERRVEETTHTGKPPISEPPSSENPDAETRGPGKAAGRPSRLIPGSKQPALRVLFDELGLTYTDLSDAQKCEVAERVGDDPARLETWRTVVRDYALNHQRADYGRFGWMLSNFEKAMQPQPPPASAAPRSGGKGRPAKESAGDVAIKRLMERYTNGSTTD